MTTIYEECLKKVDNRFELVLLTSKRAKDINRGAKPTVTKAEDKSTVIAMREIAEDAISIENLENMAKNSIVNGDTYTLPEEEFDNFDNDEQEDEIDDSSNDEYDDDEDIDDDDIDDEYSDDEDKDNIDEDIDEDEVKSSEE